MHACYPAFLSCNLIASAVGAAEADKPVKLAEFVVTPSRFGVAEEKASATATLTSRELETLPQVGDDLYRSIARLPGLAADDFSAQFWVRGAPHRELRARLDGLDLIEPFHLKDVDGALSLVDPQTISRLDLSTGGFGGETGDRLAGVMTMETKTPAAAQTRLGLSPTGVGGMNQGVADGGKARWVVAARRGYPDIRARGSKPRGGCDSAVLRREREVGIPIRARDSRCRCMRCMEVTPSLTRGRTIPRCAVVTTTTICGLAGARRLIRG
jgi:hypothetical protein